MPLKAIVDGATIIGPDLSDEEWTRLNSRHKKGLPVRMSCCGNPGHLRISKKGTRHFYHASATGCNYEQESKDHLEIKYRIYRICKSEQWETYVEFPAPDRTWISDVCAIKDGRKIVFEIQISKISFHDLEERDKKYRNEGIESYWLLDNFLERTRDFESWYHSHLSGEDDRREETIPYIDNSQFDTGPENHIFISKGIRSVGLNAQKQTLFTTNNKELPLAVWVREVLKGNYQNYLKETSVACQHKRQLKNLAAPLLIRFRELYHTIVRDETYRNKVDSNFRIYKNGKTFRKEKALQKKFDELYSEIDWLGKEYHSCIAESYGLFMWKKIPEYDKPRLVFRLESALKIRKLEECVKMFNQWEASFIIAFSNLELLIKNDLKNKV
ncbi:MAG TPA: competence protein CoiA family protein [Methanoregula sp.]|nr:competence protein CoiA family protein [Methanoregula sp.]